MIGSWLSDVRIRFCKCKAAVLAAETDCHGRNSAVCGHDNTRHSFYNNMTLNESGSAIVSLRFSEMMVGTCRRYPADVNRRSRASTQTSDGTELGIQRIGCGGQGRTAYLTNLGAPNHVVNTPQFGTSTQATKPGRQIQLIARVSF